MEFQKRLERIWGETYMDQLPKEIKERGFANCENNEQKDILIIGMNPSCRKKDEDRQYLQMYKFGDIIYKEEYDVYWSKIKSMLCSKDSKLDLRDKTTHLDLFSFRETNQSNIRKLVNDHIVFFSDQVKLTQELIESVIRPKLIVIKNREASAYFGKLAKDKGWIWMGYKFEYIKGTPQGEVCKIVGLLNDDQRVYPQIQETSLSGCIVLFSKHINRYTIKNEIPTPKLLNSLLALYVG